MTRRKFVVMTNQAYCCEARFDIHKSIMRSFARKSEIPRFSVGCEPIKYLLILLVDRNSSRMQVNNEKVLSSERLLALVAITDHTIACNVGS